MFCSESCEHGLNATSTGRVLGSTQPVGQQSSLPQPQFHMCCPSLPLPMPMSMPIPVPVPMPANDMEPPRVGMCFVTEGPEGLSIDCNVPLPNSFNLEEYKKQMNFCPPLQQGNPYFDNFCLPPQQSQPLGGGPSPNPAQMPNCSCQYCQCTCSGMPGYEQATPTAAATTTSSSSSSSSSAPSTSQTQKSPSKSPKQDRTVAVASTPQQQHPPPQLLHQQHATMMPPFFCVAAPTNPTPLPQMDCTCLVGPPMQTENGSAYLCSMIPTTNQATQQQQQQLQLPMPPHSCHFQAIGLLPIQQQQQQQQYQSHHLHLQQQQQQQHQQQMLLSSTGQQELQQPLSPQLMRFDFPFPCLLTELRRDKDKSCCDQPSPPSISSTIPITSPPPPSLAFQVYAPMPAMTVFDRDAGSTQTCTNQEQPPPQTITSTSSSVTQAESEVAAASSTAASLDQSPAAPATTTTTSNSGKRSCLRNKDSWSPNGPGQMQNSYAPPSQQCGPGNVCMKCGNCWHCPRCSNCYWHPGGLRQNVDKRR